MRLARKPCLLFIMEYSLGRRNMKKALHIMKVKSIKKLIHRIQVPRFLTIFFAMILVIIYRDIDFISIFTLVSGPLLGNATSKSSVSSAHQGVEHRFNSTPLSPVPGIPTTLMSPPVNSTREERIRWLKEKLPELDIFWSSQRSDRFHGRVVEFFKDECSARFFMTWLSPADHFGPREILCVDSLFKANPSGCLLILSGPMDTENGLRIMNPIIQKGFRVAAVTPNMPFLVENTPAQAWFEEMRAGKKDPGVISLGQNLSNLMRLAFMYKYGGVYMDTDFLVLKRLDGLNNAIGAQSVSSKAFLTLNQAVITFDPKHPLMYKFIEEFASTFDGNKWGFNGPYLVTRVIKRIGSSDVGMGYVEGANYTVLPPEAFYPVDWKRIKRLFRGPKSRRAARWVDDEVQWLSRVAYGVHLWNKKSRTLRIEEGSVMERLILDHCVICQGISTS